MTDAVHGFGTVFQRETTVPGTYADLGTPFDVTVPELTRDTVDATSHKSPNRVREFISGLRDQGEAGLGINYVPGGTAFTDLKADWLDDDPVNYKILFPNGESVSFSAFVTRVTPTAPMEGKKTLVARFKLAGEATWS
ncbi:phage tail tube protein [Phenylobacterium sp.]|uniref:phage tail tube protein n=1 Tax=Phenylobacterium sp. TaxID=1871053 RepID=UPI00392BA2AF